MTDGYYWYRERAGSKWKICLVRTPFVYFFGEVEQRVGNDYLKKWVEFGERVEHD